MTSTNSIPNPIRLGYDSKSKILITSHHITCFPNIAKHDSYINLTEDTQRTKQITNLSNDCKSVCCIKTYETKIFGKRFRLDPKKDKLKKREEILTPTSPIWGSKSKDFYIYFVY